MSGENRRILAVLKQCRIRHIANDFGSRPQTNNFTSLVLPGQVAMTALGYTENEPYDTRRRQTPPRAEYDLVPRMAVLSTSFCQGTRAQLTNFSRADCNSIVETNIK